MSNTANIVLIDQNAIVKSRIKDIFSSPDISENLDIKIFEAANRREIIRILTETNYNIDLIVSEMEINSNDSFDGINLIKLVKTKRSSIPVVMLTSIGRKEVITRCLREGAADYILKPFKDEYLKERLMKYINLESLTESTVINFNLKNFLDGEIYKAKKGKYPFSLVFIRFHSSAENESALPKDSFYSYADFIYREIKSLFWKADLYIQHGFQSHLGFFPFCDETHTKIIIKKIEEKFEDLKFAEPNIIKYSITHAFVTYPINGKETQELLNFLTVKSKGKK
ncbi:MAG: response regulator [Bacillota bacterium]